MDTNAARQHQGWAGLRAARDARPVDGSAPNPPESRPGEVSGVGARKAKPLARGFDPRGCSPCVRDRRHPSHRLWDVVAVAAVALAIATPAAAETFWMLTVRAPSALWWPPVTRGEAVRFESRLPAIECARLAAEAARARPGVVAGCQPYEEQPNLFARPQ